MSAKRFGRVQKMTAVVPLALLSAAWTASLTGVGPTTALSATTTQTPGVLPGGATVPAQAIEAPASVSAADEASPAFNGTDGDIAQIVSTSSTNGIPSSALAAYQRAETVINSADKSCNISWQLVAAIGRVESDHGRYAGSALNSDGVATPAIYGPALNGTGGTSVIRDTDSGAGDGNRTFDRAMGPMQFIPSTWSVVQVDADGDGVRNPQDIDDAALATAVYLCSGPGDLSTLTGQKQAVYRYNHSDSYVDLVLSIMDNYLDGDFMSVPDSTSAAGYLTPLPSLNDNGGNRGGKGDSKPPKPQQTQTADPAPVETQPTEPATTEPDPVPEPGGNGGANDGGGKGGVPAIPTLPTLPPVTVPPLPETSIKPVDTVLTLAQAIVQCTLDGLINNPLSLTDKFDVCVQDYTTPAKP